MNFRGFHYDIARGFYLQPEFFERALRLAARSGYTHFLPYLENMIRLPSMERACPSCAYTAEDWARFGAVADECGIELVPHFNVIGHAERIAPAYPELCGPGSEEMDVSNPATKDWMLRCLGEFCDISRSQYFLIGGDEWQPPDVLLERPGFDVAQVWAEWINAAVEYLVQRGRQPIVWHDMLIHYPQALPLLSRQAVIAFWFYDRDSDYAALSIFRGHGFRTLMASCVSEGRWPLVGRRALDALACAATSAKRHQSDGVIVTSWEECRWEFLSASISQSARALAGGEPAPEILEAATLFGAWTKLTGDEELAVRWKSRLETLLVSPAWEDFSELHRLLRAIVQDHKEEDVASYREFHDPQGTGYEKILHPASVPSWPIDFILPEEPEGFGIQTTRDPVVGDVLQFRNGSESFVVYPKFGASLQRWQRAGSVLVADGLRDFLKNPRLPGGYRSYSAVGGFRVIWALGTHSNPCNLWQHPWDWCLEESSDHRMRVVLRLELPHGVFTTAITVECGRSGFTCEARCVNRLEHAFGAFNFNLPLVFGRDDLENMTLRWDGADGAQACTVAGIGQSGFWVPAEGSLAITHPTRSLRIEASPENTAGYFVDWGREFITPDIRGRYRRLGVGEETTVHWRVG